MDEPARNRERAPLPRRATQNASAFSSLAIGLVTGLGWGLLFGLFDGSFHLLARWPYPEWGRQLQALAYGMAWYGLTLSLAGGAIALLVALVFFLFRRPADPVGQMAVVTGTVVPLIVGLLWSHRFALLQADKAAPVALAVFAALTILAGVLAGWASYGLGRSSWPSSRWRRRLGWSLVVCFLLVVFAPLSRALYRSFWEGRGLFAPSGPPATVEHPNIVLVTVDSLRADHLAPYGYSSEISPYLNSLASRGVTFEQAVAPSSWSRTSMAALMTSLYPSELQIDCRPWHRCTIAVDSRRTTLAELLQSAGYHTAAYLDNPWLAADRSLAQGFDQFVGVGPVASYDLKEMEKRLALVGTACQSVQPWCDLFREGHQKLFEASLTVGSSGMLQNRLSQRFIEQHRRARFFLWLHFAETHLPHDPAEPVRTVPEENQRVRFMDLWHLGHYSERQLNEGDAPALRLFYEQEIVLTDAQLIGEALATLDRLDLTDRTVVVVTADHGEAFGEHGEFTYGHTLYEELIHVPLIVAGPVIADSGARVSAPVSLIDLLPTLAEIAGAQVPAEARGRSLLPALRGGAVAVQPVYAEGLYRVAEERMMIRLGSDKLIYDPASGFVELYDLGVDPTEQKNLAEVRGQVAATLLEMLQQWIDRCTRSALTLPRSAPPANLDYERRDFIHSRGF